MNRSCIEAIWAARLAALLTAVVLGGGCGGGATPVTARYPASDLERVMAATRKYEQPVVARGEGYVASGTCQAAPLGFRSPGVMGYHLVNRTIESQPPDLLHPGALVYAYRDHRMQLVAVEYYQTQAAQNLAVTSDRPVLFGHVFDGPMLGHVPGQPIHYDLHVWLFASNPNGLFAQYNPSVGCQ